MYECLARLCPPTYLSPSLPAFTLCFFSSSPLLPSSCCCLRVLCFSSCTNKVFYLHCIIHCRAPFSSSAHSSIQSSTQRPRPRPPQPLLPLHLLNATRMNIVLEPEKRRQNRRHVHQKPKPLEIRQCHRPRGRRQMRW